MTLRAPAKLNLCLYLGPRREDGLHEIRSLFCPLTLADRIVVGGRRGGPGGVPRRRGAEPGRRGARGASGARLEAPAGEGRDREADSGRGRARRRQRRRRGDSAPGAGTRWTGSPSSLPSLGADVPSQLDPALRPGRRGRRGGRAAAATGRVRRRARARRGGPWRPPTSTRRPIGSGLGRDLAELDAIDERLRAAAASGASPLDYPELLVNDLGEAALSLRPEIAEALAALREAGAEVALVTGSGPTAFGLFEDIVGRRPGSRGAAAALRERDRGGARDEPMSANGGSRRRSHLVQLIALARDRRRVRRAQQGASEHRPPAGAGGHLHHAGRLDLRARGAGSIPRDRGLRRVGAPGRDGGDPRRRGRRPGRDLGRADDRGRLVRRGGGRLGQLPARAPAGPRLPAAPRPEGADHARAVRSGRGLLRAPRGQDDRDRPLHRPGAGAGAVHRRQLGDALFLLPPVQRARHWAVGGHLRADRLLRLAKPRRRRAHRRTGHASVRDRGRRDRRDRGRRSASCAGRRTAGGWWRGWSDVPPFARCSRRGAGWPRRRASCGPG